MRFSTTVLLIFVMSCTTSTARKTHEPLPIATEPTSGWPQDEISTPIQPEEEAQESFFEEKEIMSGRVRLLIPKGFVSMEQKLIEKKYPKGPNRPTLVFTNARGSVNIAFNHDNIATAEEDMAQVREFYDGQFSGKNLKSYQSSVQKINGRNIAVFEFISVASDQDIYNMMFFSHLGGTLFIGTFNCTVSLREEWEARGKEILGSLVFKE